MEIVLRASRTGQWFLKDWSMISWNLTRKIESIKWITYKVFNGTSKESFTLIVKSSYFYNAPATEKAFHCSTCWYTSQNRLNEDCERICFLASPVMLQSHVCDRGWTRAMIWDHNGWIELCQRYLPLLKFHFIPASSGRCLWPIIFN